MIWRTLLKEPKNKEIYTFNFSTLYFQALTVERYISICWPFLRYRFEIKASYYIWSVVTFSIIYNTPRFFEWQTYSEAIQRPCLSELYKGETFKNNLF